MSTSGDSLAKPKGIKTKTNEEIILGFQKLKNEHRYLFNKYTELDLDLQENRVVLNALKDIEGDKKCFKMIGGILCEKTVKEVIPDLKTSEENLGKMTEKCSEQLKAKEEEIEKYKEEYNLKIIQADEVFNSNKSENKLMGSQMSNENATSCAFN